MACNEATCVYHKNGHCTMGEASYRCLCPHYDWDSDNEEEDEWED